MCLNDSISLLDICLAFSRDVRKVSAVYLMFDFPTQHQDALSVSLQRICSALAFQWQLPNAIAADIDFWVLTGAWALGGALPSRTTRPVI